MSDDSTKVLCLTGSLSRQSAGFFTSVRRLSMELSNRKLHTVVFGTLDNDFASDAEAWGRVRAWAFQVYGPARLAYCPFMDSSIRKQAPDLIHVHGLWMMISRCSYRWHQQTGRPYMISARGMLDPWALGHQNWKKKIAGLLYENRHLRGAACLHALSHQEMLEYRAYGLDNPVAIIPNGVDLPSDPPSPGESPGSPAPGTRTLLFLGRLHSKKGVLELLEGWKRAAGNRHGWKLAIAGWDDGGHSAVIEQRIHERGLSGEVSLLGPQFGREKEECLRRADAFILPSHSEGLPIAVLEAWAHRLAVLMTPQCNLPIGFESGAAIQIEANPEQIATGLRKLFALHDSERLEMGRRGRLLVESSFTWQKVSEQMESVYRWLLGSGPKPELVH